MLLTARLQCPARNPDRLADLRNIERLLWILLDYPAEAAHDNSMLALGQSPLATLLMGETFDHRFNERLFETPGRLRMGYDFGSVFGQLPGCRV